MHRLPSHAASQLAPVMTGHHAWACTVRSGPFAAPSRHLRPHPLPPAPEPVLRVETVWKVALTIRLDTLSVDVTSAMQPAMHMQHLECGTYAAGANLAKQRNCAG